MRQLLLLVSMFMALPVLAAADDIESLQQAASEARLAERSQWLALLHYRHEALGDDLVSQADDARFFISPVGDEDPAAELKAALSAFLKAPAPGHAQCLFPARWAWLRSELNIDERYEVPCPKLDRWRASISDDGLTLVFPAMYLNNPGSAFGHTFLRFDHATSVLLSHALNYAAQYDPDDDIISYSIKGITGGYTGVFNLRRYFQTVQEYSDLENRDIWEYRLDYSREEIDLLLKHVWELLQTDFRYYFFSENCSYRLLGLLDVMREGSTLAARDRFPLYAVPVDTVRAIDDAGIVTDRTFRPSLSTRIDAGLSVAEEASITQALRLVDGDIAADEADARALDLAIDILEFHGEAATAQSEELLLARSRLPQSRGELSFDVLPPEQGHRSARAAIGVGEIAGTGVLGLQLRPVFHDLLDADAGFVQGAQIEILSTDLVVTEDEVLELESLTIFDMRSLPAWRRWYRPISWTLALGFERAPAERFMTAGAITTLSLAAGAGSTWALTPDARLSALIAAELDMHHELVDEYSMQLGVNVVWQQRLAGGLGKLLLGLESLRDVAGQRAERSAASVSWQFDIATDTALRVSYVDEDYGVLEAERWSLRWLRYF